MDIQCGRFTMDLDTPKIMGVVNLTPDSFSDGAMYSKDLHGALLHAEQLLKDGADILDIGGESSRPNAAFVSSGQEWFRIKDVLHEIKHWNIPISLDTRKSEVMKKAIDIGSVDIINDIEALQGEGSIEVLSANPTIAVILMHMQGQPQTMQNNPYYTDVTQDVLDFLEKRILLCMQYGIAAERLIIDPGIGFGKTLEHNLTLIRAVNTLKEKLHRPLLIGVSRKSMFESITGEKDPLQRIGAGVVAEIESVRRGANFIRTHNVKQTRQALLTYLSINYYG